MAAFITYETPHTNLASCPKGEVPIKCAAQLTNGARTAITVVIITVVPGYVLVLTSAVTDSHFHRHCRHAGPGSTHSSATRIVFLVVATTPCGRGDGRLLVKKNVLNVKHAALHRLAASRMSGALTRPTPTSRLIVPLHGGATKWSISRVLVFSCRAVPFAV